MFTLNLKKKLFEITKSASETALPIYGRGIFEDIKYLTLNGNDSDDDSNDEITASISRREYMEEVLKYIADSSLFRGSPTSLRNFEGLINSPFDASIVLGFDIAQEYWDMISTGISAGYDFLLAYYVFKGKTIEQDNSLNTYRYPLSHYQNDLMNGVLHEIKDLIYLASKDLTSENPSDFEKIIDEEENKYLALHKSTFDHIFSVDFIVPR